MNKEEIDSMAEFRSVLDDIQFLIDSNGTKIFPSDLKFIWDKLSDAITNSKSHKPKETDVILNETDVILNEFEQIILRPLVLKRFKKINKISVEYHELGHLIEKLNKKGENS